MTADLSDTIAPAVQLLERRNVARQVYAEAMQNCKDANKLLVEAQDVLRKLEEQVAQL